MNTTLARRPRRLFALLAGAALFGGCDEDPTGPNVEEARVLATLQGATARYRDIDVAVADGFILLHECEVRPGEGAVGILYVHLDRFTDGILDPMEPDGLLYAPNGSGKPDLIGVEVAMPAAMWSGTAPPEFLDVPLQLEEEFDAWGLHIWVWRENPDGMFAQAHPGVSCN
jgi:hypothetical protein